MLEFMRNHGLCKHSTGLDGVTHPTDGGGPSTESVVVWRGPRLSSGLVRQARRDVRCSLKEKSKHERRDKEAQLFEDGIQEHRHEIMQDIRQHHLASRFAHLRLEFGFGRLE